MKFRKFKKDEAVGKVAEGLVTTLLSGCGLKTTPVSFENKSFWDITFESPTSWKLGIKDINVEVKHDVYQQRSGNLAIEIWNCKSDKPSGLKISKAHLWTYVLSDSIWICNTQDLRMFTDSIPPKRLVSKAGDGNATIILYDSEEILNAVFHRIDNIQRTDILIKLHQLCQKAHSSN